MKKNKNGFVLAETLVVTTFVAGILIYIFIQFTNLSQKYNDSFVYNTVEGLYALEDVKDYIEKDENALSYIETGVSNLGFIDITDCNSDIFTNSSYCIDLLEYENINRIFITTNKIPENTITEYSNDFLTFINKINEQSSENYRIVASFNNNTFATIRFGE